MYWHFSKRLELYPLEAKNRYMSDAMLFMKIMLLLTCNEKYECKHGFSTEVIMTFSCGRDRYHTGDHRAIVVLGRGNPQLTVEWPEIRFPDKG